MWGVPFRDTWLNIFDTPKSHFFIKDCIVDYETGLIYKDGDIVWETANENMVWTGGWVSGDPRWMNRISRQDMISERMRKLKNHIENKIEKSPVINTIDDSCSLHLLHPFNRYVFGHLFDTLQKLSVVEEEKLNFDSIILPKTHEIIDIDSHLKAIKIHEKIRHHSDLGIVRVKNLLYICPPSHPTSFTGNSFAYIRRSYADMLNLEFNTKPDLKLFLTRRKDKFKRYLINDVEVQDVLDKNGIITLDGTENFLDIAKLFSKASHVAGVHGSLFTNNIYGNSVTKYLEYCPRKRENHTFHHQLKICDSYTHTLVDGDEQHNISLVTDDLMVFFNS